MGIEKIDKNFEIQKGQDGDKACYEIPHSLFALHGVFYEEPQGFVRVPSNVAQRVSDGVRTLSKHTSGGRLCFSTDSASMQIKVSYDEFWIMSHMPLTGSAGFSLHEDMGEGERFVGNFMPISSDAKGFTAELKLQGGKMHKYVLYFPLYNEVKSLSVLLDASACVEKYNPYKQQKPILYYGSSITQGGCASRPDNAYPALICKKNRVDYINLGFSGSAKGEELMVDYLTEFDCSLFVCDYDYNAPTAEHLQATHYALYQRYRKKRPNTPILFISKADWQRDPEGDMRCAIIQNTYQRAKKEGDEKVYFLSGKDIYEGKDSGEYTVDGCHPTDCGFRKMADAIYKKMRAIRIEE